VKEDREKNKQKIITLQYQILNEAHQLFMLFCDLYFYTMTLYSLWPSSGQES
jgi:hypothetical protein